MLEEADDKIDVAVGFLRSFVDPFERDVWGCGLLRWGAIDAAVQNRDLNPYPFPAGQIEADQWTLEDHEKRVAYLVVHGWHKPISVDVGVPGFSDGPRHLIYDGNHRFAAAIFRDDATIAVDLSGSLDHAREIGFPIDRQTLTL